MTTYHHANVRGRKLFYREAGSNHSPTIVLFARLSEFFAHVP